MELNIYWKVFVEGTDDEDMLPYNQKRLIHVYTGEEHFLCYFNGSCFVEYKSKEELHFKSPVFWRYVEMLPNMVKSNFVQRCMKEDGRCEYEDDGYCWDKPDGVECMHCKGCFEYHAYNS